MSDALREPGLGDRLDRIEEALGLTQPKERSPEERLTALEATRRRLLAGLAAAVAVALAAAGVAAYALVQQPGGGGLSVDQQRAEARLVLRTVDSLAATNQKLDRVGGTLAVASMQANHVRPASLTTARGKKCLNWILTGKGSAAACGLRTAK